MLKLDDIANVKFDKSTFGYKPEDVDTFIANVYNAYSEAMKQNEIAEAKIMKLAEKLNEYREDEEALKDAIIGAQKQKNRLLAEANIEAERILQKAKDEAESLVNDAKERALAVESEIKTRTENVYKEQSVKIEAFISQAKSECEMEANKLKQMKMEVTSFKEQLTDLYNRQLRLIMELPEADFDEEEDVIDEEAISEAMADTANVVEEAMNKTTDKAETEETSEEPVVETQAPVEEKKLESPFLKTDYSNSSKFDDVKFGTNK